MVGVGGGASLDKLKRMEVEFCVKALKQCFGLCMKIGRELVRLLQDLVCIPKFRQVWKDLLFVPAKFGVSAFSDISQLYCARTSSQYFLLRISPEMETQLRFLLTHVKFGSQRGIRLGLLRSTCACLGARLSLSILLGLSVARTTRQMRLFSRMLYRDGQSSGGCSSAVGRITLRRM